MDTYDVLTDLRDRLADLPGVTTCKIGLEDTLTPADYPIICFVPSRLRKSEQTFRRIVEVLIYFGRALYEEAEGGLEGIYEELLDMETAIVAALKPGNGYLETVTDNDRLEHYKLMAVRGGWLGGLRLTVDQAVRVKGSEFAVGERHPENFCLRLGPGQKVEIGIDLAFLALRLACFLRQQDGFIHCLAEHFLKQDVLAACVLLNHRRVLVTDPLGCPSALQSVGYPTAISSIPISPPLPRQRRGRAC